MATIRLQIKGARVEALANTLGYDNAYAIDSQGRRGGIGIFWNNTINVEILGDSVYHIDAKVVEEGKDPWRLTCVYGEAQTQLRHQTWDLLKGLASFSNLPWLFWAILTKFYVRMNMRELLIGVMHKYKVSGMRLTFAC